MSGTANPTAASLGIIDLIWGSTKFNVDTKSSSFKRGGLVSTAVVAGRQVTQSQSFMAPEVSASFPLAKGMSLDDLKALAGQPLVLKCDSGQTYTINGAFLTGDPMVKGGAGSNVSCKWSGQPAPEVVS
jgi:hypothetical protein